MRIGVMLRAMDERQGTGVYTQNLITELLALDKSNEYVLFYRNPAHLGRFGGRPNVRETVVRAPGKALWDQLAVPAAAAREKVDLVFHTKFTVPLFTGIPTVMTIHGASWFVHPELYSNKLDLAYVKMMMPVYCRKSSLILSNSQLTTDDFVRILHVPREKIRTVRLGANDDFKVITDRPTLDAARKKYSLPEKFILSVIKYDPRKNFKSIIAAFRLLRKRLPCKLVVAGIDCDRYRDEYALASDGAANDVIFTGWVDRGDLPLLYNLAQCKFFPSVYEEFGIPVVEAMACGCPPVVSNTGALPEVAGDAGIIVDPFNPAEMAGALEKLWSDEAFRADRRQRCLDRAKEFTWKRCAEGTLAALESLSPTDNLRPARGGASIA